MESHITTAMLTRRNDLRRAERRCATRSLCEITHAIARAPDDWLISTQVATNRLAASMLRWGAVRLDMLLFVGTPNGGASGALEASLPAPDAPSRCSANSSRNGRATRGFSIPRSPCRPGAALAPAPGESGASSGRSPAPSSKHVVRTILRDECPRSDTVKTSHSRRLQ